MGCDMCGASGQLYEVRIEGTIMQLCNKCKVHGEVIRRVKSKEELAANSKHSKNSKQSSSLSTESGAENNLMLDLLDPNSLTKKKKVITQKIIVEDFNKRIKQAREALGLKQEDLAKKLKMKESLIHAFETGHKKPSFAEAGKLERALHISLTEEFKEEVVELEKKDFGELTLGHFIKIKKKK